ncbi:MAG: HAD-IA family hydrolase [Chloroflexi bacterium]|nr:HAD-IA family hydrolase [Chloroflexota bacterium]
MMSPYAAVLFDLDGTLLDSIDLIVQSFQHATLEHLGVPIAREAVIPTIGRPLTLVLEEMAPGRGAALWASYEVYLRQHHDDLVRLYPGVTETLAVLRDRGYPLGIVTSKRRAVAELAFATTSLDALMAVIICVEDAPRPKPAPDPLLAAADRLGLPPAACLYVGDSVHDLQSATAAGMPSAAALWGPNDPARLRACQPTHALASVADVLACCSPRR